jgi:hypothetical protein
MLAVKAVFVLSWSMLAAFLLLGNGHGSFRQAPKRVLRSCGNLAKLAAGVYTFARCCTVVLDRSRFTASEHTVVGLT